MAVLSGLEFATPIFRWALGRSDVISGFESEVGSCRPARPGASQCLKNANGILVSAATWPSQKAALELPHPLIPWLSISLIRASSLVIRSTRRASRELVVIIWRKVIRGTSWVSRDEDQPWRPRGQRGVACGSADGLRNRHIGGGEHHIGTVVYSKGSSVTAASERGCRQEGQSEARRSSLYLEWFPSSGHQNLLAGDQHRDHKGAPSLER